MVNKQDFINRYIERLLHILNKELPDEKLSLQEMVDKADEVTRRLFCK